MSRTSNRKNKTIYQIRREELGLSRAKAAELTYITENRLEKLETEKTSITPDDVVAMSEAYKMPELCSHYCACECAIGDRLNKTKTERKGLAKIVLEVLTTLNSLDQEKNRLIEIAADEAISKEEVPDFVRIQKQLESISETVDSLKLWISTSISEGSINSDEFVSAQNQK